MFSEKASELAKDGEEEEKIAKETTNRRRRGLIYRKIINCIL
jgi:hypothetical protein